MTLSRVNGSGPIRTLTVLALAAGLVSAGLVAPASAALPSSPRVRLIRTIRTNPFTGSGTSAKDDEGSAYVPRDGSLWLADDDSRRIYEVDAATGALKRTIERAAFTATPRLGGGATAGLDRSRDLESLAYDEATDTLYAFSGPCCDPTVLPTAFRLTRRSGSLQLDSYQPLPGSDFTAAAWNPGDGKLYVGFGSTLQTYDYAANAVTSSTSISGVSGILGMDFTSDGRDLLIARSPTTVTRVDWASRRVVSGWNLDLSSFGLLDTRAVEVVDDQLWVSDGYDFRAAGDPSSHAVFVFDLGGSTSPPTGPDPVASFTTTPTGGTTPLAVTFTDTSTGSPTSWRWSFGDGTGATTPSATHTYTAAGTFTASLTVSNASGSSTVTQQISVTAPAPQAVTPPFVNRVGNPGFESNLRGWAPAHKAGVTLTRVHGGHTGSWCARIERVSGARTVTLDDAPNWVTTTQPGTYTANLWVRSGRPGATLRLRLREVRGGTTLAKAVVPVRLTDRWQKVSATLVPTAAGSSTIDYTATLRRAGKHASFKADDAELTLS